MATTCKSIFWKGIKPINFQNDEIPQRIMKLCSTIDKVLALSVDYSLYIADLSSDIVIFKKILDISALDIACDGNIIYIIDINGRLFKTSIDNLDVKEEIIVKEPMKICSHGFKSSSYNVKFKALVLSDYGQLLLSSNGQLWGIGKMPQMSINENDLQKISFFEGRTIHGMSLGSNFAAVISRKTLGNSNNFETDSETEDEEVFISECYQCRSTIGLSNAPSSQSLTDTCPLGIQINKSSDESSTTSVMPPNGHLDTHSLTDDTTTSTEIHLKNYEEEHIIGEKFLDKSQPTNNVATPVDQRDNLDNKIKKLFEQPGSDDKTSLFLNTEAAKQFLSRQLSWVSASEDYLVVYTEKPTRIIKDNVTNLTNLVYESVKNVGDRVVTLSRHVSGSSDTNDTLDKNNKHEEDLDTLLLNSFTSSCKLDDIQISTDSVVSDKDQDIINSDKLLRLLKLGENILSTEVWTWGEAGHGQLGVGDNAPRSRAMLVSSLNSFGIQKVAAGSEHCTALTLDGRLFIWGKNDSHQVSFDSKANKYSPIKLIENLNDDRIRDVTAHGDHTVICTSSNKVLYMGNYGTDCTEKFIEIFNKTDPSTKQVKCQSSDKITAKFEESFATKRNKCFHWRLLSSHSISYYFNNEVEVSALPELTIAQRVLEELILIYNQLVKPILKKCHTFPFLSTQFEILCVTFSHILYTVALNVTSLWQFTERHISQLDISIVIYVEEFIFLYKKYVSILCDIISASGFTQICTLIDTPSCIFDLFTDQIPTSKQKSSKKTSEATVSLAFLQPLARLTSYRCIIQSFIRNMQNYHKKDEAANVLKKLKEALQKWETLIDYQEKQKKDAETIKLFWETCGKVLLEYKKPERRLIRESRSRPLSMVNAGRFSSHWFILFNDVLVHVNGSTQIVHPLCTLWVEPSSDTENVRNQLQLITPEETINVFTNTSEDKTEWFHALHTAIKLALNKKSAISPPALRTAEYQFSNKSQLYKDAKYKGRWFNGKLHGLGKIQWPDGKMYIGQFQLNVLQGYGKMNTPEIGVYEGHWKDNLQNGYGIMKYKSGDVYEGYFKDGLAHGHGVRRQGDFTTSTATIYMGEWNCGVRQGYGVMDNIGKGEKYLGSWSDNKKHGCGLIVTLDGIYYEGIFMQDILTGHGVMIFEDGTHYEGEFKSAGVFSGKGTLTLSSGDKIEGHLNGAWTDGVKISNATLQLNVSNPHVPETSRPNSFGKLSVAPNQKWNAIFRQCYQQLGLPESLLTPTGSHFKTNTATSNIADNKKIWQNIAVIISSMKKDSTELKVRKSNHSKIVDYLELIPDFGQTTLTLESYGELKQYVQRACESSFHPLGQLVQTITSAFNTTYGGVRVHPLLLSHAVKELKSITSRIYFIVRMLFPALPMDGNDIVLPYKQQEADEGESNAVDGEVVSASVLLQSSLLPRIYPALFVLYALHNKHEDDTYWRRLMKWNRQPDVSLMAFLGIDQKFRASFTQQESLSDASSTSHQEQLFLDAIETLQQLKTTFSPIEKLLVIRSTFQRITSTVHKDLGASFLWSMDELFPVFHFVVVRARILQLGSEIHFIEDFLDPCMQHGELGIMLTTLKACYFQILQEKMTMNE